MAVKSKAKSSKGRKKTAKAKTKSASKPAIKRKIKSTARTPAKEQSSLVGKKAPAFSMPTDSGATASLNKFRGKRLVLYFYPKDNTTGCTTEAQAFRDAALKFAKKNAVIVGVSKDSLESHRKFKAKQELNFDLASDAESKVCEAYGVWKKKNMYGRTFMGIERSTFLIDEKGIVRAEWRKVRVPGHAEEVYGVLESL